MFDCIHRTHVCIVWSGWKLKPQLSSLSFEWWHLSVSNLYSSTTSARHQLTTKCSQMTWDGANFMLLGSNQHAVPYSEPTMRGCRASKVSNETVFDHSLYGVTEHLISIDPFQPSISCEYVNAATSHRNIIIIQGWQCGWGKSIN